MKKEQLIAAEILERFSFKIFGIFLWFSFTKFLSIWAFFWGGITLFFRVGFHYNTFPALYGLLGIPILIGLAIIESRKKMPSSSRLLEILDKKYECGGLLIASEELNMHTWAKMLPPLSVPSISWKKNRYGPMLIAGIFFAITASLIPVRFEGDNSNLDVACETKQLTEKIDLLRTEGIISQEKADSLKSEIESLAMRGSSEDPGKTFEAIDHLNEIMQKIAEESAGKAIKNFEKLTTAEKLAEKLLDNSSSFSLEKEQAMKELSKLLNEAMQQQKSIESTKNIMEALDNQKITGEQLTEAIACIQKEKASLMVKLEKLEKNKLISKNLAKVDKILSGKAQKSSHNLLKSGNDKNNLNISRETGSKGQGSKNTGTNTNNMNEEKCDVDGISNQAGNDGDASNDEIYAFGETNTNNGIEKKENNAIATGLDTNTGEKQLSSSENFGMSNNIDLSNAEGAGTGGISRGRGDASLNFAGHTIEEKIKFKEQVLPLKDFLSWKESLSVGVAVGSPLIERNTNPNISPQGKFLSQSVYGGSAFSQKILPRHRNTVKRYFERK